jgi:hypothetical protein
VEEVFDLGVVVGQDPGDEGGGAVALGIVGGDQVQQGG